MRSALFACLLAVSVAGCAKDSTGPNTALTVTGTWNATAVGSFTPGGSAVISLTLTQTGSTVTGTGTISDATDPPAGILSVTGNVTGTDVSLTLQVEPQQYLGVTIDDNVSAAPFAGTLTASTLNGNLTVGDPGKTVTVTVDFTKH
jgi:hypothetical protein